MRHPAGLYVASATEMWERFGYYLMAALLDLYLIEGRGMSPGEAGSLVGAYTALVYASPLVLGQLADRWLGYRRAVQAGAALLATGYAMLAIPSPHALYAAIGVLIVGNGLFKPSIATLLGNLYPQGDPRRDAAFGIFYMGINIGAFFAPIAGASVQSRFGWGAGFLAASAGMVVGLTVFLLSGRSLAVAEQRSSVAAVLGVPLPPEYEDDREPPAVERARVGAVVLVTLASMVFWFAAQQNATSLVLWARDHTDLTLGGLVPGGVSPLLGNSLNPFFVVFGTPLVVGIFSWLRRRGVEPSTPAKISIGLTGGALSFGIMVVASLVGGDAGRVSALWLVGSYAAVSFGELCLSPMILSLVTKLSPRRMTATMMGVMHLGSAAGNYGAGKVNHLWSAWPHSRFFAIFVVTSLLGALAVAGVTPRLRRLMAGRD